MKILGYSTLGILVLIGLFWIVIAGRACNHIGKSVDNAVINYEEYQEIFNTTKKLNTDLCVMKELPAEDKMFEQFSKVQRTTQIKTQLNRWVEEYNAKSKMFNRSIWKSNQLPYQLNVNQFNCY